jgi:DNA primase
LKISQSTIDEILSRVDIVDLISDFVTLKKTGQNYIAKSPFTEEKTPSFFVFPRNQNFKDFSSGKQGNAISFIMEYDGLSYIDAIKYLGKKSGIEIEEEEQTPEEALKQNERESLYIILNYAKDFFKKNLWETEEGRNIGLSYFRERGFTDETIQKFELGYSLDAWNALENDAKERKYNIDLLEKAGLIIKNDQRQYDRFRGRVIFPIHSITGKSIAFGARMLSNEKNQPKYLNSPETEVYHKSNVLYGLFQSSRAIRLHDNCYLVEGYTDVISLHQCGVENVVSSSGTSLTENQIKLIQRHTQNITVLFDGDAAGIRASVRGIDMILQQGMDVRAVVFPDGEDPDSYSRKLGAGNFQDYLKDNAQDFIRFKTNLLKDGNESDPMTKANTISQIIVSISQIPDPLKRAVYIKETSSLLNLEEQLLYGELNKIFIKQNREQQKKSAGDNQPENILEQIEAAPEIHESISSIDYQEREAVRILITYGFNKIENEYNLVEHYIEELENIEFTNPVYDKILTIFKEELGKGHIIDKDYFLSYADQEISQTIHNLISVRHEVSENWQRYQIFVPKEEDVLTNSVYSNILRIKFYKIKLLIQINAEKLKHETDPDKQTELQKIDMALKKARAEFAIPLGRVVS